MVLVSQAKVNNDTEVVAWGTGNFMREFLYVDDMAQASLFVLELDKQTYKDNTRPMLSHINVGTGNAMREFLYVDDMAEASLFVLELDEEAYQANTKPMLSHINVGTGKDVTIREMAQTMKRVVGYKGKITFDITKSDGAPRKLIDVTRLENMGWKYSTNLEDGLIETYKWYLER